MKIVKIWENESTDVPREKMLIARDETERIELGYVSRLNGESTPLGFHDDEEEIYVILKGRAILKLGDEEKEVSAGDTVYVPRCTEHRMRCISDEKLEYLYFANWPE
jgi:mannose-6-phosphate isomerase-like protein (cupin superfamily)